MADRQALTQRCDHPRLELWLGEQAADPAAGQAGAQSVQMSSAGAALGVCGHRTGGVQAVTLFKVLVGIMEYRIGRGGVAELVTQILVECHQSLHQLRRIHIVAFGVRRIDL